MYGHMAEEFDWLTLEEGEEVLWSSRAHKYSLYVGMVFGALFLLVGSLFAWLSYRNTHYVVTNKRIYAKRGTLSRNVKTVDFDKVQNINYTQSALGAQFGYGNVEISTAGSEGAEITFRSIPDPADVQELIDRRIDRDDGRDADGEDVLAEILAELRAIRGALEGHPLAGGSTGSTALAATGERAPEPSAEDADGDATEDGNEMTPFEGADPVEDAPSVDPVEDAPSVDPVDDPSEDG